MDRIQCKTFAKLQLQGRWGLPIAMYFIIFAATFVVQFIVSFFQIAVTTIVGFIIGPDFSLLGSITTLLIMFLIMSLITLIYSLAISLLSYSSLHGYLELSYSKDEIPFSTFFKGFKRFGHSLALILWQTLWTALWTLLLIIPGIIKYYSYSQALLLGAENQKLTARESLTLSKIITKGHKAELFLVDLSFLGWCMLSALSFGIGFIWITPYMTMTSVNVYHSLLEEAINNGIIPEELLVKLNNIKIEEASSIDYTKKLEKSDNQESESNENQDIETVENLSLIHI